MLSFFINWARSFAASHISGVINSSVTISKKSENNSARLDIDTLTAIARITFWESGEYDAEIIELRSEKLIYTHHGKLEKYEPLYQQFRSFFDALGIA